MEANGAESTNGVFWGDTGVSTLSSDFDADVKVAFLGESRDSKDNILAVRGAVRTCIGS